MRVKLLISAIIMFASCSNKKQQVNIISHNQKIGAIYCDSALVTDTAYYLYIDTTTLKITRL